MIPTSGDLWAVAPMMALGGAGLLVLIVDLFVARTARRAVAIGIALCGCIYAGVLAALHGMPMISAFAGQFVTGGFTTAVGMTVIVATALSLLMSYTLGREDQAAGGIALMLFSAMGAMLLAGAASLMTVFLGIELLSLALYPLCGLAPRATSREAALKYLILSSTATGFMLYGMALVFGATGIVSLTALYALRGFSTLFAVGVGLFSIGLAFKLSLVPFHAWTPDVYEGAPLPVTAFMSVVTKLGVFAVLSRVAFTAVPERSSDLLLLPLWIAAALSMIVGNVAALAQTDMKRLLAYSGIAQIGYVVAAFAARSPDGFRLALFYMIGYTFMNLGAFAVVAALSREHDEGSRIASFTGLAERNPALAAAMTLFLLSLTGLPPTVGFIAKLLILWSTIDASHLWLGLTLIVGSAISAYAYLKIVRLMYSPSTGRGIAARPPARALPLVSAGICAIAVFVLGIFPRFPADVFPLLK